MIQTEMIWKQILESAELIRELGDKEMLHRAAHITYGQSKVLRLLFRHHPDHLMLKDIAAELGQTKGAVSQTVDALLKEGFIYREGSATDHRVAYVGLSEKGMAVQQRHVEGYNALLLEAATGVSEDEAVAFLAVLERIVNGLKQKKSALKAHDGNKIKVEKETI